MTRKRRMIGLGVLLVVVCLVRLVRDLPSERAVVLGFLRGEPFYHGKPLSYWVERTKFRIDYGPATIRTDPDESDGTNERGAAWQSLVEMGPAGARGIISLLHDDMVIVRYQAAIAIGQLRGQARPQLPELMEVVRRELALARRQENGEGPPPANVAEAREHNPAFTGLTAIREIEAIYQIDRNQTPFVVGAFLEAMVSVSDLRVHEEAWNNLHEIDPQVEVEPEPSLWASTPGIDAAKAVTQVETLQGLRKAERTLNSAQTDKYPEAIGVLVYALTRTDDNWVRVKSWQNLQQYDPTAALGRAVSLTALGQNAKSGPEWLAKAKSLQTLREAEAAYNQSPHSRPEAVAGFLDTLVRTQDPWVRNVAWNDLQTVDPDAEVMPTALVERLRRQPGNGMVLADKVIRIHVMHQTEALLRGRVASSEKIGDLVDALLRSNDKWLQNKAWVYLRAIDPKSATVGPALTKALGDQSAEVRRVAAKALEQINTTTNGPDIH